MSGARCDPDSSRIRHANRHGWQNRRKNCQPQFALQNATSSETESGGAFLGLVENEDNSKHHDGNGDGTGRGQDEQQQPRCESGAGVNETKPILLSSFYGSALVSDVNFQGSLMWW